VDDLPRVVSTLTDGAKQMEGLAGEVPAMPNAGSSSGAVGDGITALSDVMVKAVKSAANSAGEAKATAEDYDENEHRTSESLTKARGPH
jgi:hypothetical protein